MASNVQEKFGTVRKKLDQLGFRQPLGVDSLPLVERLLSDLMWTTENLRKSKTELERRVEIRGKVEQCIAPYKQDNGRLVKENSQLHQRIIQLQQTHDEEIRDLRSAIRKLENSSDDLKFFNNQCLQKLRESEQEMKQMVEKIIQLQEKNFQAVVHTPGGRKKSIPFRRQRMDIDCLLPPSELEGKIANLQGHDENEPSFCCIVSKNWQWIQQYGTTLGNGKSGSTDFDSATEFVKGANRRCEHLQMEYQKKCQELELSEHKVANFRRNLELRDQEIERLNQLLEGGRSLEALTVETRYRDNERVVSQLQLQVDLLQQKNDELERQLNKTLAQLTEQRGHEFELENKNRTLQDELSGIGKWTRLEDREKFQETILQKEELVKENGKLREELTRAQKNLSLANTESNELQRLVDILSKEKSTLQQRLEECSARERDLMLQLDRSRKSHGTKDVEMKNGSSISNLSFEKYLKRLEQERDYWKQESEMLSQMVQKQGGGTKSPMALADRKGTTKDIEKQLVAMEKELLDCRKENEQLLLELQEGKSSDCCLRDREEIKRLTQQRDNLQSLLDKFEKQLCDIQLNISQMTKDRDHFKTLYQESRMELHNVQQELLTAIASSTLSKHTEKSSSAEVGLNQKQLEVERNISQAELQRLREENVSLKEQLNMCRSERDAIATSSLSNSMKTQLERELAEVQRQKDQLMKEKEILRSQCCKLVQELENMCSTKQQENDLELQLSRMKSALSQCEERARNAEGCLKLMEKEISGSKEEINRLKSLLHQVEAEKDTLHNTVDERTEQLHTLQRELSNKERALTESKVALGTVEQRLTRGEEASANKDRELKTLRKQVDLLQTDLEQERRRAEQGKRDSTRLQEDLAIMTRETHALQSELRSTAEDREEARMKVQVFMIDNQRIEQLLVEKEQEKKSLLEQYRLLSLESERYQSDIRQLQSDLSAARLELVSLRSTVQSLQNVKDKSHEELHQIQEKLNAQTRQINTLTRSLEDAEHKISQFTSQQDEWIRDMSALRDLCNHLELGKDAAQRQLATSQVEVDELRKQSQEMSHAVERLQTQVRSEQESVRNLETILSTSREQEYQTQLELQERTTELHVLKDNMDLQMTKHEQHQRELTRLRSRTSELESDVDRLNRQVTSERFDKERALQELRRAQQQIAHLEVARGPSSYRSPRANPEESAPSAQLLQTSPLRRTESTSFERRSETSPRDQNFAVTSKDGDVFRHRSRVYHCETQNSILSFPSNDTISSYDKEINLENDVSMVRRSNDDVSVTTMSPIN